MSTNRLDLFKTLLSNDGQIDITDAPITYVDITAQIRKEVLVLAAHENGCDVENSDQQELCTKLKQIGDVIPIMLLEEIDLETGKSRI